ncbi:carbohydrate sulfotransferase [Plakobranchus ocellatus]|uniref:Carbohydrate sulfotransferase n=1 Tax=Plakobranchus ocellatus TaxID=259542 RepID=A0AAV4DJ57_9GAST|nr:carbohydrate sulfotransferase [Plakobranchus ocellatus]
MYFALLFPDSPRETAYSLKLAQDSERSLPQPSAATTPASKSLPRSQAWKQHIHEACVNLRMVGNVKPLSEETLENILVDDKHKLLYCQIPKVASTTWRRMFLQLSGTLGNTDPFSISSNDIHHKYDDNLVHLSDLPKEGREMRLRDYFKFVYVREPFERILSAYKNKFKSKLKSADYFRTRFGKRIAEQYRDPPLRSANDTDGGITFEEFVTYLVDFRKRIKMNEHWERFHKLCRPCLIDYDFVGHLEQMSEDTQYILDSNFLSDSLKVPSRKESNYGHKETSTFMKEYYSKLPRWAIRSLYQMYKADFIIFNYTIPAEVAAIMSV